MTGNAQDTRLRKEVLRALRRDARFDDARIGVSATDGVVTLTGTMTDYFKKLAAERVAGRVSGVNRVANDICVRLSPHKIAEVEGGEDPAPFLSESTTITPEAVRERIEQTLEERAQREARCIRVDTHGGMVTLEGRVHSWEEKREIIGALSQTPGVRGITDRIHIDPYF